jgi:hypothetical protein
MEIAFDGRDWDRLVLHAQQGQVAAADDSEHWELLGWWAQAHPACLRTHGASRDERDHHVHMLAYTAMGRADAGLPPSSEEAHLAPIAEGAVQEGMDEKRLAHMAECYTLEQRWAELHEGVLRLDQEWQRLMEAFTSCEGAGRNGQRPGWAEQAATFFDLSTHAEHTSALAAEALQTCARFAQALQQAVQGA